MSTKADIDRLKAILGGEYTPLPRDPFDLQKGPLFGGIAGIRLPVEDFEVFTGLTLTRTYAHLIAPFLMAFSAPKKPNQPHPGPLAALSEGGMDILVEAKLAIEAPTFGFDRLNALWFLLALLRLRTTLPLQMPVIADRSLKEIPAALETANLLPVELDLSRPMTAPLRDATEADLLWVRDNFGTAAKLMVDLVFNRAVQTFDRAVGIPSPGAGIVIAWASIETLIRPGSQRIRERICKALATHLEPPGSMRDSLFSEISASYEARGGAAHAGESPELEQFYTAFRLARKCIMRTIESGTLPEINLLLERWRART